VSRTSFHGLDMICVSMVRDGYVPAGTNEACAESGGHLLLVGSGLDEIDLGATIPSARVVMLAETQAISLRVLAHHIISLLDAELPSVIVFPASPDGRDLAPLVAHQLRRPLFAGSVKVCPDRVTTTRTAGRVGDDHLPAGPFVATFIPGTRGVGRDDEPHKNQLMHAHVDVSKNPSNTSFPRSVETVALLPPDPTTMDLTEASRIVGGGQGLKNTERFAQLGRIGGAMGASLGGTRVASDAGWIPFERQIGTTGVIVKPKLYLAFAISGATQHTSGLGDPDHVIAVNTDSSCPMMAMADVAIVADANAVLDALEKRLIG
jgi:electron transfer flavoprotein alpha subunit